MQIINAIGRRKTSIARVYVKPGKGDIKVNNRDLKEYFLSEIHQTTVRQAFTISKVDGQYDVSVNVEGGGIKGQAEAVRLGIARALVEFTPEAKPALRKEKQSRNLASSSEYTTNTWSPHFQRAKITHFSNSSVFRTLYHTRY